MATSENIVLVSFNVQLRSKQIVPWTFLPVDRTMTVAELCKSIFVGDFTVAGTLFKLNLAVNLGGGDLLQKYGAEVIFFLYSNKNVPSAEIFRGRRCLNRFFF
jgi:hypothetical protein